MMNQLWQQIGRVWSKMNDGERALFGGMAVLTLVGGVVAAMWGSSTSWRLLHGDLDRETVSKALTRLSEASIKARTENDGRSIVVDERDWERAQTVMAQNQIFPSEADTGGWHRLE